MWRHTRITNLLGLDYPIVQGPFGGGISSTRLAAVVSNAGGLGSYGAHMLSGAQIRALVTELRELTDRPFNVNLWVPLSGESERTLTTEEFATHAGHLSRYHKELGLPIPERPANYAAAEFEEQLEAVIESRPPVASFVFGTPPRSAVEEMKRRGIAVIGAATTVEEAVALERAGMNAIVASGCDAGGHRPTFLRTASESLVGTFSLVPQVVDAVGIPVIAAGGIADGRGVVAALGLGASAAQIGTAFLACHESNASETHKRELVSERARWTGLTREFTGRLARGIRNELVKELEQSGVEAPPYPVRAWFMSPLTKAAAEAGRADRLSLWAGQAAGLVTRRSASEFFAALVRQVEEIRGAI